MTLTTLGVGAQASPVFAPAGLLVVHRRLRVMLDGGPGAAPAGPLDAWLVCDERAELRAELRRLAAGHRLCPRVAELCRPGLRIVPRPVRHTSHPTFGYLIEAEGLRVVWAPEFFRFPRWAAGADLMFAEAAGWDRPILFAGGVGGHMAALAVAEAARRAGVRRLAFAHIGRPTLRALASGQRPPFGEVARDGQRFRASPGARGPLTGWAGVRASRPRAAPGGPG
jgi:Beta-lactamase superfamily domain